jgi:protein TonB
MRIGRAIKRNWAMPASVCLHAAVVVGFLVQFANSVPSLPADAVAPSLAVEVMLLPTLAPDVVNTAPPPPPPPPEPEVVEEPPPIIESVAEAAPSEPPPPPPKVKRPPDPKPTPVRTPPVERPPAPPAPPAEIAAPLAPPAPAPPANQLALAAPSGRTGPPPDYVSLLVSHIKRQHRLPRGTYHRTQYVVAMVEMTIDRRGKLMRYAIAKPTGVAMFDKEIPELMKRVDPMPALPPEIAGPQYSFTVPIEFIVR